MYKSIAPRRRGRTATGAPEKAVVGEATLGALPAAVGPTEACHYRQHNHHLQHQHLQPQPQPWAIGSRPWLDSSSFLHDAVPPQPYKLGEDFAATPLHDSLCIASATPDDVIYHQPIFDDSGFSMPQGLHPNQHGSYMQQDEKVKLGLDYTSWNPTGPPPPRPWSTISSETRDSSASVSSACSSFSPVQTEDSDTVTLKSRGSRDPSPLKVPGLTHEPSAIDPDADLGEQLVCLAPKCQTTFDSPAELDAHIQSLHTFPCNWTGCGQPSFSSHNGLVWHVKAEHLLVCPSPGCTETSAFASTRLLKSHIAVAHPEQADGFKEWKLTPETSSNAKASTMTGSPVMRRTGSASGAATPKNLADVVDSATASSKRKCAEQLRSIVEKRARNSSDTPQTTNSQADWARSRAFCHVETAKFPLVFEQAILPFLVEYIPKWAGPKHVISTTRGKKKDARRICIMTQTPLPRLRKMIIARHVLDLVPETLLPLITFVFSTGEVNRIYSTWARGPSQNNLDDICAPRNPYYFSIPCMGDSVGICGNESFEDSTATLGPCITVGGGSYWLVNFHPFLEAYKSLRSVPVEHPSIQDRSPCVAQAHDAISPDEEFKLGDITVTSGLNLETTRISHDPYWEECGKDPALAVTDWALISAPSSRANILRRFPSETQALSKEALVKSTAPIVPGAAVISSGRTSGYQRGQICEIPAYVSGEQNGTHKATREWFIEEPHPYDNEDAWIRGGIGVEGDSGAAVIDAETNCLLGQLWGRNRYWGPGPRHTFFTPIADIFDDIQEKCGQTIRPQLPQSRDEAECFAVRPSCTQCYELQTYLESRRSSRISLQSMVMSQPDTDQDLVSSIEAVSELATPRDIPRGLGVEEVGASFNTVLSPGQVVATAASTPMIADMKSPYPQTLELEDILEESPPPSKKRGAELALFQGEGSSSGCKKSRVDD